MEKNTDKNNIVTSKQDNKESINSPANILTLTDLSYVPISGEPVQKSETMIKSDCPLPADDE